MDLDFERSLIACRESLLAFAVSLTHNRESAEDFVQETMLIGLAKRHQFQTGTNLKAWLFTILRNCHYSYWRREKSRQAYANHEMLSGRSWSPPEQDARIEFVETFEFLAELPFEHREAIEMIVFEGHSYERASELADTPIGTMKSRLSRARAKLQEMLEGDEKPLHSPASRSAQDTPALPQEKQFVPLEELDVYQPDLRCTPIKIFRLV